MLSLSVSAIAIPFIRCLNDGLCHTPDFPLTLVVTENCGFSLIADHLMIELGF